MDKDEYVRKGDLLKKTKGIGIGSTRYRLWKARTCVLLDVGTFFYYASEDKKKGNSSVAMINLRNHGSKVAPATNTKRPFSFTVCDDEGEHLFRARSDEEMQEWIDDIQLVLNKFHPRGRVTQYTLFRPVAQSPWAEQPLSQQVLDADAAAEYESSSAGSSKPNSVSGVPHPSPIPRSASEADTTRTAASIVSLPLQLSVLQASMKRTTSEPGSAPPSNDNTGGNIRPIEFSVPMESPVRGPNSSIRSTLEDSSVPSSAADSAGGLPMDQSSNDASKLSVIIESEDSDDDMAYFAKALRPSRRGSQYQAVVEHVRKASVAPYPINLARSGGNSGATFAPPAALAPMSEESLTDSSSGRVPKPHYNPTSAQEIVPRTSVSSSSSTATTSSQLSSLQSSLELGYIAPLASVSPPGLAGTSVLSSSGRWTSVKPASSLSPRMVRGSAEKPALPVLTSSTSAILVATTEPPKLAALTSISSPNLSRIANYHASRRRALGASGHINSMAVSETERAGSSGAASPRAPASPTSSQIMDLSSSPMKLSAEQVDDLVFQLLKDVDELERPSPSPTSSVLT